MVGSGSVHIAARTSAPEVAAADDKTDLNAHIDTFLDCGADIENGIVVNTHTLSAGEHLAAYFQKYTFIRKLHVTASIQKNIIFRCKDKKTNSQQFNKKRTRETRFAFVSRV